MSAVATELPSKPGSQLQLMISVVRAEWTKMRSVRSTYWTLAATMVVYVAFAAISCGVSVASWSKFSAANVLTFNVIEVSLSGAFFAQITLGVLGVLVVTSEYGTGQIRTTFAAVPQRRLVLTAKALIFFLVAIVTSLIGSVIGFLVGQAIIGTYNGPDKTAPIAHPATLSTPHALRAVLGAALFSAAIGLIGLSLGAMIRRTTGAIFALIVLVFLAPVIIGLLPNSWQNDAGKYLPTNAGSAMYSIIKQSSTLSPGVGFVVLLAYSVVALGIAGILVRRRDA